MQKKGTSYSTKRAWLDNDDKKVCKDYLKIFAFICSLSFDVYVKKLLIEKLVDEITPVDAGKKKK